MNKRQYVTKEKPSFPSDLSYHKISRGKYDHAQRLSTRYQFRLSKHVVNASVDVVMRIIRQIEM